MWFQTIFAVRDTIRCLTDSYLDYYRAPRLNDTSPYYNASIHVTLLLARLLRNSLLIHFAIYDLCL